MKTIIAIALIFAASMSHAGVISIAGNGLEGYYIHLTDESSSQCTKKHPKMFIVYDTEGKELGRQCWRIDAGGAIVSIVSKDGTKEVAIPATQFEDTEYGRNLARRTNERNLRRALTGR